MEEITLGAEAVDYSGGAEEEQQPVEQSVFEQDDEPKQHRRKRRRTSRDEKVTYDDQEEVSKHQALILQLTRFGSSWYLFDWTRAIWYLFDWTLVQAHTRAPQDAGDRGSRRMLAARQVCMYE